MWGRNLKIWLFFVKSVCGAVIFLCTLYVLSIAIPPYETKNFPVLVGFGIISVAPGEVVGSTRIKVQFTKIRKCEYIGTYWYHQPPDGAFEPATLDLRPAGEKFPIVTRPLGKQIDGPWDVGLSSYELLHHSFSEVKHRCYPLIPFWITTTRMFP